MPEGPDPYRILQVDPEAEDEVIQAAYRRLARKYHPDVATGAEAAARMSAINAAWALIGKPERRAAYDAERGRPERAGGPGQPERGGGPDAPVRPRRPDRPGGTEAGDRTRAAEERQATGGGPAAGPPPPETVSRDWTSGRSNTGGGYDASMRTPEGVGAAGPPPGRPSGSVLNFGRYAGWSLGEVARQDIEYIEWLDRAPIGRQYRDEIDQLLRRASRRTSVETEQSERRGLFRR